jgi:hypothetical protein
MGVRRRGASGRRKSAPSRSEWEDWLDSGRRGPERWEGSEGSADRRKDALPFSFSSVICDPQAELEGRSLISLLQFRCSGTARLLSSQVKLTASLPPRLLAVVTT